MKTLPRHTLSIGYAAAVVCFPLLLMAVNDSWVFLPPGTWIDPYIYTGYFLDLTQHLNVFSAVYYGTRLPWILLGAAVHALLPFEMAQYALRLILFYAAAFSLFAIVRMLFRNDVAATLSATLLGAHTYFLRAIGWDYVEGCGVALILVTMACLTAAARSRHWRGWLAGAGAAAASMVFCYIMLVLMVPFQIGAYLFVNASQRRNPLPASLIHTVVGATAATGVFGAINWVLANHFLFFLPQLRVALFVSERREQWKAADYSWVSGATWLIFTGVAVGVGLVLVVFLASRYVTNRTIDETDRYAAVSALLLFGVAGTFALMDFRGFWLLQYFEYAGYLMPAVFICIGAALAISTRHVSGPAGMFLVAAAAVALIAPFAVATVRPSTPCLPTCQTAGQILWLAGVGTALLAAAAVLGRATLVLPAFIVLGIVNISATPRGFEFPASRVSRARALMIPDALAAIRSFNLDGNLRFWYDFHEPLGGVFRAVSSANLWAYRVVTEDFPGKTPILPEAPVELGLGDAIAILSSRSDALELAARSVSNRQMRPDLLGSRRVARGAEAFDLTIVRLVPAVVQGTAEIDLNTAVVAPVSQMKSGASGLALRTSKVPWSTAAQIPIPTKLRDEFGSCGLATSLRIHVARGTVGIGVLNAAGTAFLARRPVRSTPAAAEVLLGVPRLADAGNIVIQSWDTETEGQIDVSSISLLRYGCPAGVQGDGFGDPR